MEKAILFLFSKNYPEASQSFIQYYSYTIYNTGISTFANLSLYNFKHQYLLLFKKDFSILRKSSVGAEMG